mmetsp:Transcript_2121/g.3820  ORF Transcript_2121/g.3820 Transcript_2121/m.3820 type:complete len:123 (+) Transcript_2121:543-911(+)
MWKLVVTPWTFRIYKKLLPEPRLCFSAILTTPLAGRVWSRDELRQVADVCCENNVLIVSDEIHGDLCYGRNFTPMACIDAENTVTLTSPAKTLTLQRAALHLPLFQTKDFENICRLKTRNLP